jgi:hypothetical protein
MLFVVVLREACNNILRTMAHRRCPLLSQLLGGVCTSRKKLSIAHGATSSAERKLAALLCRRVASVVQDEDARREDGKSVLRDEFVLLRWTDATNTFLQLAPLSATGRTMTLEMCMALGKSPATLGRGVLHVERCPLRLKKAYSW